MVAYRWAALLVLVVGAFLAPKAFAQQCDCQQIVGKCRGAIEFVRAFGSAPSFGAEIVVHSSERTCSKVEYYLDGTPHQTVLVNKNKEPESLFGTSPISEQSVRYEACRICAVRDSGEQSAPSPAQRPAVPEEKSFTGLWTGSTRWFLFSESVELEVSSSRGALTGSFTGKNGRTTLQSLRATDSSLNFEYVGIDGIRGTGTLTKISADVADVEFRAGPGVTFSGQLTRSR